MKVMGGLGRTEYVEPGRGMDAGGVDVTFEHAHAVVVFQGAHAVDGQLDAGGKTLDVAFELAGAEQKPRATASPRWRAWQPANAATL